MSDPKDTKAETGEGDYDPDLDPNYDHDAEDPMEEVRLREKAARDRAKMN